LEVNLATLIFYGGWKMDEIDIIVAHHTWHCLSLPLKAAMVVGKWILSQPKIYIYINK
jgi:hypothetical protein